MPNTAEETEDKAYDEKVIALAVEEYARDGEIEIDDNAIISHGEDNGAYVAAWVWVDFTGTDLDKETANPEEKSNV